MEFGPDIIFLSAGFDAHESDIVNQGYIALKNYHYQWFTESVVKIANE